MPSTSDAKLRVGRGLPQPFGVSALEGGKNFALFSANASAVTLLIRQGEQLQRIPLNPLTHRSGHVWHVQIAGLAESFDYAYQVKGPEQWPHAFDEKRILSDPYAKALSGLEHWGEPKGEIWSHYHPSHFDWDGDRPLERTEEPCIIYELHVRGYTMSPASGVAAKGTYKGLIEKIPYLKELGITAVELLPVHEFDECDNPFFHPKTGEKLKNYWGYNAINFFAVKSAYAHDLGRDKGASEFKEMVKAFHEAGIEVILDVVFNHSAEGGTGGKVYNFKGLENGVYYILEGEDYANFSGCGNTLNCNHPVIRSMILEALCHLVTEYHIDGFRFDLASILSRDEKGEVLPNPPLIEAIAKHPVLAKTRIIAEAWDAKGLYQVGNFPAAEKRWAEWNGQFRDVVRRFSSGETSMHGALASRFAGSEDLYKKSQRSPHHSINFITSHDGFTMADLVSYIKKRNEDNGEENRDGENHNISLNFGKEGPSKDPKILEKRGRQQRNLAMLLLLSHGTPMILAGDEFGNSQQGNNNAWCQDNPIGWTDWCALGENWDHFLFWRRLIQFRKEHYALTKQDFFTGEVNPHSGIADLSWHGETPQEPEFDKPKQSLALLIDGMELEKVKDETIYIAMNFSGKIKKFELPKVHSKEPWKRVLDSYDPLPFLERRIELLPKDEIWVQPFSIQVLLKAYG